MKDITRKALFWVIVLSVSAGISQVIVDEKVSPQTDVTLESSLDDTSVFFDSDEDRINRSVNRSWIYIDTRNWQVDPSHTNESIVKLEQDGRGLTLRPPTVIPQGYKNITYSDKASWNNTITNFESRGFDLVDSPEVMEVGNRRFTVLEFNREIRNYTIGAHFIATEKDMLQYSTGYSYVETFVSEDHLKEVLSLLSEAKYKKSELR